MHQVNSLFSRADILLPIFFKDTVPCFAGVGTFGPITLVRLQLVYHNFITTIANTLTKKSQRTDVLT